MVTSNLFGKKLTDTPLNKARIQQQQRGSNQIMQSDISKVLMTIEVIECQMKAANKVLTDFIKYDNPNHKSVTIPKIIKLAKQTGNNMHKVGLELDLLNHQLQAEKNHIL